MPAECQPKRSTRWRQSQPKARTPTSGSSSDAWLLQLSEVTVKQHMPWPSQRPSLCHPAPSEMHDEGPSGAMKLTDGRRRTSRFTQKNEELDLSSHSAAI